MVTDHYSPLLQPKDSHRPYINEWTKLCYNKTLFMVTRIWIAYHFCVLQNSLLLLIFFFTHLRTSNTILTSELYKSRTAAMFGPWAEACWSWIKLSIKHEGRTCLFSDPEKVTQKDDLPQPFPRKFFGDVAWQMGGVNQTMKRQIQRREDQA